MDINQALAIINVSDRYDKKQIKKKYRELMRKVHPDNYKDTEGTYEHTAQEINEAYSILNELNNSEFKKKRSSNKSREGNDKVNYWDAPINEHALFERKIFDEVHDQDGNIIGLYEITKGKYIWTKDEEFHLFLKSIFSISKEILDNIDNKLNRESRGNIASYQAELSYLLASQYINSTRALFELNLDIEDVGEDEIFYIPAMLEGAFVNDYKGKIIPLGVQNHRLYVGDEQKNNLGYISFKDDKLSFIVTPLFEQKCVQVKMRINNVASLKRREKLMYQDVDLWIKVPAKQAVTFIDNINLKIGELINKYEKDFLI